MNKLVTDDPKSNFQVITNMVYAKDGWQHIHFGEEHMLTVDFCLMLCKERGCDTPDAYGVDTNERKDEMLMGCAYKNCPIAAVYAALSGFGHVRGRLKMYEDAGMEPPKEGRYPVPLGYWKNLARERGKKLKIINDVIRMAESIEARDINDQGHL